MKLSLLNGNGRLMATLATVLFAPALAGAATVIDHVPYTITAPGEYVLQSNLTANQTVGITVQAADVVINLNGFTLAQSQEDSDFDGIEASADDVTVRNGTISGFRNAVSLDWSQSSAENLKLLRNKGYVVRLSGNDSSVVNCFIVGAGNGKPGNFGVFVDSSGDLVQNNHICELAGGILSESVEGCAVIHNYIAASAKGLVLSDMDYYEGNVVTGCFKPFVGGNAIGTENGGY